MDEDEKDGKVGSSTEEEKGKGTAQLEDDDDDGELEDEEELYDKDGKPLPWANSKRFRRLYREAKEGRKVLTVLNDAGISGADLQSALSRLQEFEGAYAEWQRENAAGRTDEDEDAQAKEARKQADAVRKRLKELGFVSREELEAERVEQTRAAQAQNLARSATQHLAGLLEDAGLITDDMDDVEKGDIVAEWDVKVGRRISRDPDDARAFRSDHRRVINKHFKAVLGTSGRRSTPDRGKIDRLPSRVKQSGSPARKSGGGGDEEPRTIRDAVKSMLTDMKGRRE